MATKTTKSWMPVPYKAYHVRCIQSLARGDADERMQKDALKWIIEVVAGTYDMPYYPESERDTAFACGRMYVGKTLVKMLALLPNKIEE